MTNDDFKKLLDESLNPIKKQLEDPGHGLAAINKRLGGIEARLDNPDAGLAAINRRLDANTAAIVELESTVKGYADMYKINDSNVRKMEKRLEKVEEKSDIDVPPEFQLADVS